MELATVVSEPVLRRCWLLNKALESASLDEALKLARAADEFLGGDQAKAQALLDEMAVSGSSSTRPSQGAEAASALINAASSAGEAKQDAEPVSTTDQVAYAADIVESASATENHGRDGGSNSSRVEEAGDSEPQAAITSGLAVLAGMDDIVRFLRQQDDVVVSAGTATYLVNGRFQLNSKELLDRANKIRDRQGKPQFQCLPYGFPSSNGGDVAGRGGERT
jgi:hypothetical protein